MTKKIQGALTRVPGFKAAGVACGIKASGNKDLALIMAEHPCTAVAVFTKNSYQAAPVLYDKALLEKTNGHGLRAILVNAGNANACTGEQGLQDASRMAQLLEESAQLPADSVFVMSTGIIGQHLPMDALGIGTEQALNHLGGSLQNGLDAAEAIMTTDLVSKEAFRQVKLGDGLVSIGGIAKGSGMIHPDMATMLAAIVTDANLTQAALKSALNQAVNQSFNRVSVDGDTSTNDTVVLLASGQASATALSEADTDLFVTALSEVCVDLARQIARDGEGATKLIEIQVTGAASDEDAALAAKTIAISPLVKTAMFGNDPNWGRILMAAGRSGANVNPDSTALWLQTPTAKVQLVEQGQPLAFDAEAFSQAMHQAQDLSVLLNLGSGEGQATYWTCDFSYKYVEINAEYHT